MVTRSLESAQRKVEQRNFDIRKQLLEYDDVANDQRKVIYQQRNELLETEDISETITAMRQGVLHDDLPHLCAGRIGRGAVGYARRWNSALAAEYQLQAAGRRVGEERARRSTTTTCSSASSMPADEAYQAKIDLVSAPALHQFERNVMLQSLDTHWREHLAALDHLRQGIHLRGYAQKNPKQEYKREAFELFEGLLQTGPHGSHALADDGADSQAEQQIEETEPDAGVENVQYHHADYDEALAAAATPRQADEALRARRHRKSGATIPVPAARARNTSTATAN